MALKTKSIRAEVTGDDGLRICVMRDFHPERHANYKPVDEHWVELAPSEKLLAEYHRGLCWSDYVSRFTSEVLAPQRDKIQQLADLAMEREVTILCYEAAPENCHRRLIALACQMYQPDLKVRLE